MKLPSKGQMALLARVRDAVVMPYGAAPNRYRAVLRRTGLLKTRTIIGGPDSGLMVLELTPAGRHVLELWG